MTTMLTMPPRLTLTAAEQHDLSRCEKIIERGLLTFREVGLALIEIKEKSLYRNDHATFSEYCRERWGFSRQRAHQLIQGAKVADRMSTAVDTPIPSERVARELNRVPPDQQVQVWQESVERADGVPTAEDVRAVVGGQLDDHDAPDVRGDGDHGDDGDHHTAAACPNCGASEFDDDGDCAKCKEPKVAQPAGADEVKLRGVGVSRAHEALNCLMRIPKNDPLRERGFQVVADWIDQNHDDRQHVLCPREILKSIKEAVANTLSSCSDEDRGGYCLAIAEELDRMARTLERMANQLRKSAT